ncbi:MAG: response regulator [Chloroflexi bacterium]|nr:response regulator [Chloroflexota bacterium]
MSEKCEGKVLAIEDDEATARLIATVLMRNGFDVTVAHNAETGLARYHEIQPDCVVLDVNLPDRSGLDILREIRQRDAITQVLMLTAQSTVNDRIAGLKGGADDYLAKPFHWAELVERVRKRVVARERVRAFEDEKATAIDEVVRRYATTIPHELAQPLSLIIGYSELIMKTRLPLEEFPRAAEAINAAGQELAELIRSFSTLRRYQTRWFAGSELIDLKQPEEQS